MMLSVLINLDDEPLAQSVYAGQAHAVQTAADCVAAAAEFATRVQLCKANLDGRHALRLVNAAGYAPAVVLNGQTAVGVDCDVGVRAVARERLVYGVVEDFHRQVVQPLFVGGADIHSRALSDGFKPFEHLNIFFAVMVFCRVFYHITSKRTTERALLCCFYYYTKFRRQKKAY